MTSSQHLYEIRPRKDHRGVDLISDAVANLIGCTLYGSRRFIFESRTR